MQVNPTGAVIVRAIVLGGLFLLAVPQRPVAAQDPNDITLRLTSTTGNPGDMVEVSVELVADSVFPESFALFLAYDPESLVPVPDAYEIIARDEFTGDPILDGQGNTIADFSLIRLAQGVSDADKTAAFQVYPDPGAVGVLVHGLNQNPIPAGPLMTLAFRILSTAPDASLTDVLGVDEAAQVHVPDGSNGVAQLISSFSRTVPTNNGGTDVVEMTYGFEDTAVVIGCIPAAAPTGVTATQNRSDSVALSWNAVSGDSIEYRVFRSTTNTVASAVPIGEQWQSGTTFNDITARVPETVPGECLMPDMVSEVHYFYWVRARSEVGCESALSTPSVEGFRVQAAKSAAAILLPAADEAGRMIIYGLVALALVATACRRGRMGSNAA